MKKIFTALLLVVWGVVFTQAWAGTVKLQNTTLVPGQTYTETDFDIIKTGSIELSLDGTTMTFSNLVVECDQTESAGNLFAFEYGGGLTTVQLIGENTVKTKGYVAFEVHADVTFTGAGSLAAAAEWRTFWFWDDGLYSITFEECSVEMSGNGENIDSNSGTPEGRVVIKNATVKGNDNIWCKEFELDGVEIVAPEGAEFNTEQHCMMVGEKGVEGYLGYTIMAVKNYNIWIAGKRMNNYNAEDFKADGVVGTIKYFEETNTLILENATISKGGRAEGNSLYINPAEVGLFCDIDGLIINLSGENKINGIATSGNTYGMGLTQSASIVGGGKLDINGGAMFALMIWNNKTLTINDGSTLIANGTGGIAGQYSYEKLIVNSSYVDATGSGRGSITDIMLELNDAEITTPYVKYDETEHDVVKIETNTIYYSKVSIAPLPTYNYYIYIGGEAVTNKNCDNFESPYLKSGKISYDFEENVLTLDNVVFDLQVAVSPRAGAFEIRYGGSVAGKLLDKLTVKLLGENTVTVLCDDVSMNAFHIDSREVTFVGGTLKVKGNDTSGNNAFVLRQQAKPAIAIFDGVNLNIEGRSMPLGGYNPFGPGQIKFKGTNAVLTSTGNGSVFRFCDAIDFEDCYVETPEGATYDAEEKSLVKDGEVIRGKVIIKAISKDPITITAKNVTRTYGDANPELKYTVEGGELVGEPIITCEATTSSDAGEYDITLDMGSIVNPNVTLVKGTLTIEKAELTVKAKDATRMEGEDNPDFFIEYSGWKLEDDETVLTTKPTATCEATPESSVGEYDIVPVGGEAKNYEFKYVNGTLTVTAAPVPVVVTVIATKRAYGDENPVFTFTVENGSIEGEPLIICEATKASPVGDYEIKIEKGTITNERLTLVSGTLTVEKAELIVKAKDAERMTGEENPTFEVEYEGWKNDENETVLITKPTITCEATPESSAGTYDIVPAGGEAANYAFKYVNGTLNVIFYDAINALNAKNINAQRYNLSGQRVNSNYRGVVIVDGKKHIMK